MMNSFRFMDGYTDVRYTHTDESVDSFDIIHIETNTELGSYGVREMMDGKVYTYGTAIAEPRMSYCIKNKEK